MLDGFFTRPQNNRGWIEVICGCMFSGKTEELIRQVRRAHIAKQRTQIFKPIIDNRYSADDVSSHDKNRIAAFPVSEAREILTLIDDSAVNVAIDEAQFFNEELIDVACQLADQGKRVIVAGLDTDWRGRPFGPMPHLLAIAEVVRKQQAICRVCGAPATRTQRLVPATGDILIGSSEAYEARCREHFDPDLAVQTLTEPRQPLTLIDL